MVFKPRFVSLKPSFSTIVTMVTELQSVPAQSVLSSVRLLPLP